MLVEHRGNLAELDPQATNVDLLVKSSEMDQLAVGPKPHQIACAVTADTGSV